MSEETRKDVITLSHVGMEFHLNKEKVDSLKEYFIKLVKHDIAYTEFWALKDVTFSVKQGFGRLFQEKTSCKKAAGSGCFR